MIEGRSGDDDHKRRREYRDSSEHATHYAGDQVAHKPGCDNDWAGCNHRNSHGIEELPFSQPVEIPYHTAVEERHDCQAAAEYERPSFGKEEKKSEQSSAGDRTMEA